MRDPDLQPAIDLGLYTPGGKREFARDSPEGLVKSLNKAHDNQVRSAALITKLQTQILGMRREYRIKLWVLTSAVVGMAAILGWLIDWVR
jgi:hypothetical protein